VHLQMCLASDSIPILGRTKAQLQAIEQALRAAGHATYPLYDARLPQHAQRLQRLLVVLCDNAEQLPEGLGFHANPQSGSAPCLNTA